jgi:hypothetical protein
MTRVRGVSGGGISGRNVVQTRQGKSEPVSYPVSMNRPSEIGLAHYYTPEPLKSYSTPVGPTSGTDCRPGGNGRMVMKAGSQSTTPAPTPMGRGRSLFK